jgi:hypothetical protein
MHAGIFNQACGNVFRLSQVVQQSFPHGMLFYPQSLSNNHAVTWQGISQKGTEAEMVSDLGSVFLLGIFLAW